MSRYVVLPAYQPSEPLLSPETIGETAWQERALCAQTDPEIFFPELGGTGRDAKKVCRSCDVTTECLEYALATGQQFGIWGGLSELERRKRRRTEAAA